MPRHSLFLDGKGTCVCTEGFCGGETAYTYLCAKRLAGTGPHPTDFRFFDKDIIIKIGDKTRYIYLVEFVIELLLKAL